MKISVALCTYNGSRFLREQLDSIAGQSRPPDELVICDDRSSDNTVEIAREFAAGAAFAVTVNVNDANLGSTANFAGAIERCTGDIIALSDQDDVWLPHKLKLFEVEFASGPKVGLAFSNAELADQSMRSLKRDLWRETFRPWDRRAFAEGRAVEILLQHNVVTGATMAFRGVLKPAILPIPQMKGFIHDGWISLVAAMCSEVRAIGRPLVKYRQHNDQQLGAGLRHRRISRVERFSLIVADRADALARIERFLDIFDEERLDLIRSVAPDPASVPDRRALIGMLDRTRVWIQRNIDHINSRASLPAFRPIRLPYVMRELWTGQYGVFSRGWKSAALDLIKK